MTKEYRESRKPFTPARGTEYVNEGGGTYRCVGSGSSRASTMMNVKSGWMFTAHGIGIYEDGKIDWDYSTGGRFT